MNSTQNQDIQLRTLFKAIENGYEQAGEGLTELSGREVRISPVEHGRIGMEQALALFPQDDNELVAVRQEVSGDHQGFVLLMLTNDDCIALTHSLLNEQIQLSDLTELEEEAVVEVANVIINACLMAYRQVQPGYWRCGLPIFERDHLSRIPHHARGSIDSAWINFNQMRLNVGSLALTVVLFWNWQ